MEKEIYIPESYYPDKIEFSQVDMDKVNARPISEVSDCNYCLHRLGRICAAFPLGIPNKYLSGVSKHRIPDGREMDGIVFKFNSESFRK